MDASIPWATTELVPVPSRGRVFAQQRRVGLGDVDPTGRLRLDALAAYLQDVATADYDAVLDQQLGAADALGWVVRRLYFKVSGTLPGAGERLTLRTFAGGLGSRWAERRTQVLAESGTTMECAALWVSIGADGRPARLSEQFVATYAEAAGGREVRARISRDEPPERALAAPWPLRRTDIDTLGHVNNAAQWAPVEELLAGRVPVEAEMEFRGVLGPGSDPFLRWTIDDGADGADGADGSLLTWLCRNGVVCSAARVRFAGYHGPSFWSERSKREPH